MEAGLTHLREVGGSDFDRVRVCARARMRVHLRVRERVAYLPTTVTTRQNFARRGLRRVCRLLGAETFTVIIGGMRNTWACGACAGY